MALTEERKRELDAALDLSPDSAQRDPIQVGTDEEKLARMNAKAADRGEPPITLEQLQAAQNVGQPVPEPTTGEKTGHVAGSWLGGLLDITDMPYYITQGKEAVGDFVDKKAPGVRDIYNMHPIEMAKDWVFDQFEPGVATGDVAATDVVPGLKQARETSERLKLSDEQLEQAPFTAMAGTGAEWVGVPGLSTGVNLTKTGIKAGSEALQEALPDAGKQLAREVGVSAGAATGAAVGTGIGDAAAGQGSGWGTIGELIGGVSGLVAALKMGKADGLNTAQQNMLNKLMERFENREEAIAALETALEKGEVGTLMDLTGSQNIGDVEALTSRYSAGSTAVRDTVQGRVDQIYDETVGTLRGDMPDNVDEMQAVTTARQTANRREGDIVAEGESQLAQARAAADQEGAQARQIAGQERQAADQRLTLAREAEEEAARVRSEVDPGGRPDQYSEAVSGKYNAAEKEHADTVSKPAWKAYDDGPDIDATPLRDAANDYVSTNLNATQREVLYEKYRSLLAPLSKWNKPIDPLTISLRIQKMKDAINTAVEKGENGWEEKELGKIVAQLEETLAQPIISPEYAKAVAATKEGYDRFGPAYIGDVRRANKDVPETLVTNLGVTGDRGAATIRLIKEAEIAGVEGDLANFVKSRAATSKNLQDFLIENRAMLDGLDPTVRNDIVRLAEAEYARDVTRDAAQAQVDRAETVSKQADTTQTNLQKALEAEEKAIADQTESLVNATRKTVAAEYGKGDEAADFVVQDILTTRDGPAKLAKLRDDLLEQDMAQGGVGNMESFQARVNRQVEDQLFKVFEESAGNSREAFGDAITKFRNMRRRLVQNELLSPEDAEYIDEVLGRMRTEVLRKRSRATVAAGVESAASEGTNLLSSLMSAILLAPLPGGYNLQLGGATRRYFKEGLEAEPTRRNIEALTEYLTNPQAFLDGIEKLDSPAAREKFFLTKLLGAAQTAEILGGE